MDINVLKSKVYQIVKKNSQHDKKISDEYYLMLAVNDLTATIQPERRDKNDNLQDIIEEKFASAFIRLLVLAELRQIDIQTYSIELVPGAEEVANHCFYLCKIIADYKKYDNWPKYIINCILSYIIRFTESMGIDILKHIEQKIKHDEL